MCERCDQLEAEIEYNERHGNYFDAGVRRAELAGLEKQHVLDEKSGKEPQTDVVDVQKGDIVEVNVNYEYELAEWWLPAVVQDVDGKVVSTSRGIYPWRAIKKKGE